MKRLITLSLTVAVLILFGSALEVNASATVDSYTLGCGGFSASGSTTAAFAVIEVYDPATDEDLFFGSFPVSGSFSLHVGYPVQGDHHDLEAWVWGSPTSDPEDWDGESYFYTEEGCKPSNGAPGIPAGFVMRSIICDTPVYNTAAGQPVGDARVTAGQTWYVNPKPVDGDDGKQWTEIYVSSTTNPFVPTVCVQ